MLFNTDITFSSTIGTNGYFIIGSQYITINGNNKIVTINSITNYLGLIQNSNSINNGFTNININYLGVITSNNSTLASGGGWVGQQYFGKGISTGIISATYCYSTGAISGYAGGIFGDSTGFLASGGTITASNCYSTGNIGLFAGGIFGDVTGNSSRGGSITASNCYTTGNIGDWAGGIFGCDTGYAATGGTITASNCYSTGTIGNDAGGIFGAYSGFNDSGEQ
jgi:hypothetical protein